jgi:hypothetical protein
MLDDNALRGIRNYIDDMCKKQKDITLEGVVHEATKSTFLFSGAEKDSLNLQTLTAAQAIERGGDWGGSEGG